MLSIAAIVTSSSVMGQQTLPELSATIRRVATRGDSLVQFRIAIKFSPGWHIGAGKPGAVGLPTTLDWRLPAGSRVVEERWPSPTRHFVAHDTALVYDGPLTVDVWLSWAKGMAPGPVEAVLSYGICRDVCIPGRRKLTFTP
jgi:DsbC/DsbD-like thiol-disulfide interchange protein